MEEKFKNEYVRRSQKDYSMSFKLRVVQEIESGELSKRAAKRWYGIQGGNTVTCEGTVVWRYRYTTCDLTEYDWTYTYTIDYSGGLTTVPANGSETVSCPADATDPGAPATVQDACGRDVVPVLVGSVSTPDPVTCEGTVVWTYRYTTCDLTEYDWTYTYTVIIPAPTMDDPTDIVLRCGDNPPTIEEPSALNSCGDPVEVTWERTFGGIDDGAINLNDEFPAGVTTITFTATDCGKITTREMTVTVIPCGHVSLTKRTMFRDQLIPENDPENVIPGDGFTFTLYGNIYNSDGSIRAIEWTETAVSEQGLFGDLILGVDESYTICELGVPAGWGTMWTIDSNGDGVIDELDDIIIPYNPDGVGDNPQDLGNRCYDFGPDEAFQLPVNTYADVPPSALLFDVLNHYPGGDPRIPGYWKNWNRCTGGGQQYTADANGGIDAGWFLMDDILNYPGVSWSNPCINDHVFTIETCEDGVSILDQRNLGPDGVKHSSDAAYTLAMHLLAYDLNQGAGAHICYEMAEVRQAAVNVLTYLEFDGTGDYLFSGELLYSYALELATILDTYNNMAYLDLECSELGAGGLSESPIPFGLAPSVDAGDDATVCASIGSYQLDGTATYGSITWSIVTGGGYFDGDLDALTSNLEDPAYTFGEEDGTVTLLMTVVGGCGEPVTDYVTLTVIPELTVDAGDPANVCFNGEYQLNATISDIGSVDNIMWSTSGDGDFSELGIEDPIYYFGKKDKRYQTPITLTLTVTACGDGHTDEIILTHDQSACVDVPDDGGDIPVNPHKPPKKSETVSSFLASVQGYPELDMSIRVYPNPFEYSAFMDVTPIQNTSLKIEVFAVNGKLLEVVFDGDVTADRDYTFEFDGTRYPYDSYLIRVITDHGIGTGQLIKIK